MKIGILSFHHVVNDGSAMQAVCLFKLLDEIFPGKVEIIDYVPPEMKRHNRRLWFRPLKLKFNVAKYVRERRQKIFLKQHSRLTDTTCSSRDLTEVQSFIDKLGFAVVIVGSDTVWDYQPPRNLPAAPNAYFKPLPEANKLTRLISFAASSDPLRSISFLESRAADFRNCLDLFHVRGVRDEATMRSLTILGYRESDFSFVPDPTITWGFTRFWNNVPPTMRHGRAAVAISKPEMVGSIAKQLEKMGYQVDNLLAGNQSREVKRKLAKGILERVYDFGTYEVLITDRFHSSIFALGWGNTKVAFIEDEIKWPDANSKGRDLYRRLGLAHLVYRFPENVVPETFVASFLKNDHFEKSALLESFEMLQRCGREWLKTSVLNA